MLSKLTITILKGTVNPINSKTLQLSATVGQVSIRTPTESQLNMYYSDVHNLFSFEFTVFLYASRSIPL